MKVFRRNFFLSILRVSLINIAFVSLPLFSLSQLSDNFSDGDFTANPAWIGKTDSFAVDNGMLRSSGPQASSVIYLSTTNTLIDSVEWNFFVRTGFNPSSANQVKIYLVSDQSDLRGSLNGYYVQFGEVGTAPDSLDIFVQNGTTSTKVFTGVSGIMTSSTTNSVRIKIVRYPNGMWQVFADATGGTNFIAEGTFTDNSLAATSWFGVVCRYSTSSRYNQYFFDDFSIAQLAADTIKPLVTSVNVLSSTAIDVKFSEPVEITSAQTPVHYLIDNSIGNPSSAVRDGSDLSLVHLTFSNTFANATNYTLSISGVTDEAANKMNTSTHPFSIFVAGKYDVLINELMADPDPAVGLPALEFVELYNTTAFPVSLNGWTFSDASTTANIPNVTIPPDSCIILCANANVDSFAVFGVTVGLSSFLSLNNTGDQLLLKDNSGNLIHQVDYTDNWYHDDAKKDGGWSLELIDANNTCNGIENWRASVDASGGTPGKVNSVVANNPDTILPQLNRTALEDSNTLILYFSELLDVSIASVASNYIINNGFGSPVLAIPIAPDYKTVRLEFAQNFSVGVLYTIKVSSLTDCTGNPIGINDSARFAIPDNPEPNDVVINEILFNPLTGGYDFVELYNRSQKIIDLSQLNILEMDITDPFTILEEAEIAPQSYLLFPEEFVVLSEDIENIHLNYYVENPDALLEVLSLPNFSDDEGICVLQANNSVTIDSLSFSSTWHFALLDVEDGVSLERIDYNKPTQDKGNWHSAASTVGFATPTYQNSQFTETGISDDEIKIDPEVFTPDNDGDKDFTYINYSFSEPGYMMNAKVYDAKGREIRELIRSELLASEGRFQWDGVDDDNQKARVGIYIIYIEIFNLQGKAKKFKKQVVLGAKLN